MISSIQLREKFTRHYNLIWSTESGDYQRDFAEDAAHGFAFTIFAVNATMR